MTKEQDAARWKAAYVRCIHCSQLFGSPALAEQHLLPDGSCMTPDQLQAAGLQPQQEALQAGPGAPAGRGQYMTKG